MAPSGAKTSALGAPSGLQSAWADRRPHLCNHLRQDSAPMRPRPCPPPIQDAANGRAGAPARASCCCS
eukprot:13069284-Alexandrium_andersonii.AAC.1